MQKSLYKEKLKGSSPALCRTKRTRQEDMLHGEEYKNSAPDFARRKSMRYAMKDKKKAF
jgi:hypothetical protein